MSKCRVEGCESDGILGRLCTDHWNVASDHNRYARTLEEAVTILAWRGMSGETTETLKAVAELERATARRMTGEEQ